MRLAFRQRAGKPPRFGNPGGESQTSPHWQATPALSPQEGCSGWEWESSIYVACRSCWQTISLAPSAAAPAPRLRCLPQSAQQPPFGSSVPAHSCGLGTRGFSLGLSLKAAEMQPVFVITLSRTRLQGFSRDACLEKEAGGNQKILHFYPLNPFTVLCLSPPSPSLTQIYY